MLFPATISAAYVTKVVITTAEPAVGEKRSLEASVPETASTEIYEVKGEGDFKNDEFVLGKDYTMIVIAMTIFSYLTIIVFPFESSTPYNPLLLTLIKPGLLGRLTISSYIAFVIFLPE